MSLHCLPRLCRVGTITALCRNELRVFDSFADDALQSQEKTSLVAIFVPDRWCGRCPNPSTDRLRASFRLTPKKQALHLNSV
jgi:hypothetical protein